MRESAHFVKQEGARPDRAAFRPSLSLAINPAFRPAIRPAIRPSHEKVQAFWLSKASARTSPSPGLKFDCHVKQENLEPAQGFRLAVKLALVASGALDFGKVRLSVGRRLRDGEVTTDGGMEG